MAKRAAPIKTPQILLNQTMSAPLYRQLYDRLRAQILSGQLEMGARLPSTRALASELGVSRNTTALAYELLLLEGYLESRVGAGTRVARPRPAQRYQASHKADEQDTTETSGVRAAGLSRRGQLLANTASLQDGDAGQDSDGTRIFRVGQPDVASFPYATWTGLVARHARRSLHAVSLYQNAHGYAPLREAIAAHVGLTRGVHCSPDQIILTAGSQGALDLIARVLLDPGDLAWVEDPDYPGARGALLAAGARLISVPVDRAGIAVETGRELCPEARLAIVTPLHQFPTAVTMTLSRRLALLDWAREVY